MEEKKVDLKDFKREIGKYKNQRLITITAIDEGKNFSLLYHFDVVGVKTLKLSIRKSKPTIPTIIDIFPAAEIYEREIHDFFGIEFKGNPRLDEKLFLPDTWENKPPMLKSD